MTNLNVNVSQSDIAAITALSDDSRAILVAQINSTDPFSIFDLVEGKADEIICPICGSGSGENHTGVKPTKKDNTWLYHCFASEDFNGDLIKIIATVNNLDIKKDFPTILAIGAQICNIPIPSVSKVIFPQKPVKTNFYRIRKKNLNSELQGLIAADIANAMANADKLPEKEKRGLTNETLNTFQIGVDFNWTSPKTRLSNDNSEKDNNKTYPSPRVIIPHLPNSKLPEFPLTYCAGLLMSERELIELQGTKCLKYLYAGERTPFGLNTLKEDAEKIFITEGEWDALSIYQATGGKYPCLATGGTADNGLILALQRFYPGKKPILYFVADNDDAGITFANKFCTKAKETEIIAVNFCFNNTDTGKLDANQILQENGDAELSELLKTAFELLQKEVDKIANDFKALVEVSPPKFESLKLISTKSIIASCPIDLKIPINYIFKTDGIYKRSKISSTPSVITKILKSAHSGEVSYEVAFFIDNKWQTFITTAETLISHSKIVSLSKYGFSVISSQSKKLCDYFDALIYKNTATIPTERLFEQCGWTDDSFSEFIYRNQKDKTIVSSNNFDYKRAFETSGKKEKFLSFLKDILNTGYITRFVIGGALAAPLIKILSISNKQIHLGCNSGSGKSALQKLAVAIYGNPKYLMAKFNGTVNSLENYAAALNDLPFAIEEFQTLNKLQRDNIDDWIYNYETGRTRSRNNRRGELRPVQYFSGVCITSAEQRITNEHSGEGAIKRIVEIVDSNIFSNDFSIKVHKFVDKNYGSVGENWISYVQSHIENLREDYANCYNMLEQKYPHAFSEHLSCVSVAHVALKHFVAEFLSDTVSKVFSYLNEDIEKLFDQLPLRDSSKNGKRAITTVAEFVISHSKYFPTINSEECLTSDERCPYEIYGYTLKGGNTLIFANPLREALKLFPSFAALLRSFHELNYLDEGNDKKHLYQKVVKIDGRTIRGYVFKHEVLFEDEPSDDPINPA